MKNIAIIILGISLLAACGDPEETGDIQLYDGPIQEGTNVDLLYSEEGRVTTNLQAERWLQYENGDQEFPAGIYIEFYDKAGTITSTLKANEAFYFKEDNKWRGRGDVVVKNIEKQQQLNTEELFWEPGEEKIYTDKFVTIKLGQEVLYGRELEAAQDFSWYVLKKPEGDFYVDE